MGNLKQHCAQFLVFLFASWKATVIEMEAIGNMLETLFRLERNSIKHCTISVRVGINTYHRFPLVLNAMVAVCSLTVMCIKNEGLLSWMQALLLLMYSRSQRE